MNVLRDPTTYVSSGDFEDLKHDGIVMIISSHGTKHHIITFDLQAIEKAAIHRAISINSPALRQLPRIIMYDCCSGLGEYEMATDSTDSGKLVRLNDNGSVAEMELKEIWTEDQSDHPDYKLVQIHGSAIGFHAKVGGKGFGSYLTKGFIRRMHSSMSNIQPQTLGVMMDDLQKELHDKHKQMIQPLFNNYTRNIVFQSNPRV